jgi:hypothetical protein
MALVPLAFAQTAPAPDPKATTAPADQGTTATPPAAPVHESKAPDTKAPDTKAPDAPAVTPPATDPSAPDTAGSGDVSIGEVPDIQVEELTPDLAKKAIDGYVMVHDKYQDSPLEDYQDLQEFVDKDPKGKQFETDIKSFGFNTVNDWNLAVSSVSLAYNNILNDQTADVKQQIEDIQKSTDMAQDMKDKQVKALQNSLPSENNTKIVQDLIKDPNYSEKIKLLESTEE